VGEPTLDARHSWEDQAECTRHLAEADEAQEHTWQGHLRGHHFDGQNQLHTASEEENKRQYDLDTPEGDAHSTTHGAA